MCMLDEIAGKRDEIYAIAKKHNAKVRDGGGAGRDSKASSSAERVGIGP